MDFRLILGFARPWRGTLALCALLMLAETGVALAVPWLAGQFAAGLLTGLAQREHFGVRAAGALVPALAHHGIAERDHAAHHRVGPRGV